MDVNIDLPLSNIIGGKLVSNNTNGRTFFWTTNQTEGTAPVLRTLVACADGNVVQVANSETYTYHPNAEVVGTLV